MKTNLLDKFDSDKASEAGMHELQASNDYLYMANCAQNDQWTGLQKFFDGESDDERSHYRLIRDFCSDMGFELPVKLIDQPAELNAEGKILPYLKAGYDKETTLKDFYTDWSKSTKDETVRVFLQKLIKIQRASVGEYADKMVRLQRLGEALFDLELSK